MPIWQKYNDMRGLLSTFPLRIGENIRMQINCASIILSSMESVEVPLPQNTVTGLPVATISTPLKMGMLEPQ